MTEARSIDLAVIPGDRRPRNHYEAQRILTRACELETSPSTPTQYKLGAEHWLETGETLPESTSGIPQAARRDPLWRYRCRPAQRQEISRPSNAKCS